MSDPNELAELRNSLTRALSELQDASERLHVLEDAAPEPRRSKTAFVALGSSIGTAALIGLGALVCAKPSTPPAPLVATVAPPPPPPATVEATSLPPAPPPPPATVAATEPPPPPRVARVAPPPVRTRTPDPLQTSSEQGSLTVVCSPKCDDIFDNGASLGSGNVFSKPVPAGTHNLVLHGNGTTKSVHVEVPPGQVREVRVAMPAPARADKADVF